MRIFFLRKFTRRNKSELPYPPVQKQKMANKSITLLKTWIPIYPHSQATPWSCQKKFRTALFPCIVWPVHQATVKNRETDGKATCIYKLSVLACVWVSLMIVAGVQTLILTWSNMIAHRLLLSSVNGTCISCCTDHICAGTFPLLRTESTLHTEFTFSHLLCRYWYQAFSCLWLSCR